MRRAIALPIVLLLVLPLLTACPQDRKPKPPAQGTVTKVVSIPGRPRAENVYVRYQNGFVAHYRLTRNACEVGQIYPDCATN